MKLKSFIILLMSVVLMPVLALGQKAAFNIASYNLRQLNDGDNREGNGWTVRAPHVAALISYHDFDIFGTQEGFKSQLDDLKALLPGYDYIGVGRDDGAEAGEHSAIFYDTSKFAVLDHGDFWLSETPDRPGLGWDAACVRICTWGPSITFWICSPATSLIQSAISIACCGSVSVTVMDTIRVSVGVWTLTWSSKSSYSISAKDSSSITSSSTYRLLISSA